MHNAYKRLKVSYGVLKPDSPSSPAATVTTDQIYTLNYTYNTYT